MKKMGSLESGVFWPAAIVLMCLVAVSFINYSWFITIITGAFDFVMEHMAWLMNLSVLLAVITCVAVLLSPIGKIRLGGKDAKADYSKWQWFSMALCSSIAIGLVFWGSAEPITHFVNPPLDAGVEPLTQAAAVFAVSSAQHHGAFSQYAIYTVCGLAIGLAFFNYNQPLNPSSALYFILGDKTHGKIGKMVDSISLYAICAGVAASLGIGLIQFGKGLQYSAGIEPTKVVFTISAIILVSMYTYSSYSGLNKGIAFLSKWNVRIFLALLVFIAIVGNSTFTAKLGTQAFGEYMTNFISKQLHTSPVNGDDWYKWWPSFFWISALPFAPIIGMFMARVAKGRTLREFVLVNFGACGLFNILWVSVFGGTAIDIQLSGKYDLWGEISTNGLESSVFAFFNQLPLSTILIPVFMATIVISFVTLGDSMTTCMACMSSKGGFYANEDEPNAGIKVFWGAIMGTIAYALVGFAGVDGVRMGYVISGAPMMFIMVAMIASFFKGTKHKIGYDEAVKIESEDAQNLENGENEVI